MNCRKHSVFLRSGTFRGLDFKLYFWNSLTGELLKFGVPKRVKSFTL